MIKLWIKIILLISLTNNVYGHQERWDYDKSNWPELLFIVYYGDNSNIVQLINKNIDCLNNRFGFFNISVLDVAIRVNNTNAVHELLMTKKIIGLDNYLIEACLFNSNIEIVKHLYEFGADINYIDENGYNSIMYAVSFGNKNIMEFLIRQNVDVNIGRRIGDGATALTLAIYNLDIEKIMILLEAGAETNNINNNGETAYIMAERITKKIDNEKKEQILNLLR